MATDALEFHKGTDYAVILRPGQTTDKPLASLYGIDRDVTRFGHLFAAAPELLAVLKMIVDDDFTVARRHTTRAIIAKAEGRS